MTQRILDSKSLTSDNTTLSPLFEWPSVVRNERRKKLVALSIFLTSDAVALAGAMLVAYSVGTGLLGEPVAGTMGGPGIWLPLLPLLLAALGLAGVYSPPVSWSVSRVTVRTIGVLSFTAMALGAGLLMWPFSAEAMAYGIMAWLAAVVFVPAGRVISKSALHFAPGRNSVHRTIVIAGPRAEAEAAAQMLRAQGGSYQVTGIVEVRDGGAGNGTNGLHEPHQTLNWVGMEPAGPTEAVLITAHPSRLRSVETALRPVLPDSVPVYLSLASLLEAPRAGKVEVIDDDLPAVRLRPRHESWHYKTAKRSLDLFVASAALAVALPLMLLIALAIKLDSPGGVVFKQTRIGQHRRPFSMYKFRSMRVDAEAIQAQLMAANEAQGPLFKIKDDPRITRVGKIIRRLSLDELPQLMNVLQGNMSIVGPRPPLPQEVMQYQIWQLRRLDVKPGITGLWQVSRNDTSSFDEMIGLDMAYVDGWSLSMDIKILLKTLPAMVMAKGAY